MRRRVHVLSDIHLGPGVAMTSFHEADRLCGLLRGWAASGELDELILAGDIFDFLQVPGYVGFDAKKAAEQFETIASYSTTADVLKALGGLAAQPNLDLSVLAGNHDPELLLEDVRAAFEQKIGRRGTVRWADDTPLVPRQGELLPVWGRAVHGPGEDGDLERQVWIVHGDRWDPQNVVDRDEVKRRVAAGQPVELPAGSHLVFEVLSQIIHTKQRRWVAELKPEIPAVFLLLLAFAPLETARYLKKHFGIVARMLRGTIQDMLRRGPTLGAVEPESSADLEQQLTAHIAGALAGAPDPQRRAFLAGFESYLENEPSPDVGGVLGAREVIRDVLLRTWLRTKHDAGPFDDWHGADSIPGDASRRIPRELGALVAGHTHAPRIRADLRPRYFNSGTWMPVRTLTGDLGEVLAMIEGPYLPVPSPGTFVRIDLGDHPPKIAVEQAAP
jgi:UDP-2,3-diacylglucosamine pyrophosphatase LpxH